MRLVGHRAMSSSGMWSFFGRYTGDCSVDFVDFIILEFLCPYKWRDNVRAVIVTLCRHEVLYTLRSGYARAQLSCPLGCRLGTVWRE